MEGEALIFVAQNTATNEKPERLLVLRGLSNRAQYSSFDSLGKKACLL